MKINEQIKTKRLAAGLSQEQLAEACGMTGGSISDIESGKRNLTITSLSRIAKALKVPLKINLGELT